LETISKPNFKPLAVSEMNKRVHTSQFVLSLLIGFAKNTIEFFVFGFSDSYPFIIIGTKIKRY